MTKLPRLITMGDFKLSAQLIGHESDVRATVFPTPNVVLTASRDHSVRVWKRTSASPPVFEAHIAAKGTEFVNSLTFLRPTEQYPDGLVISGGKECIIDVRDPKASPEDHAERMLIGHAHNVCTLDIAPTGKWLVSGGWDGQARIWSCLKWETDIVLDGHDQKSVWAVLAYNESTVITGCADKNIRIFDLRKARAAQAEPVSTIYTDDIVRALCRLPPGHPSGADFASAGNDGVVRLWKMSGQPVAQLHGHDSFIYSLAVLPTGEIVSSGEDRTVRIWKGSKCIQTITLPAISVWTVAVCPESGDIVAGSSDGQARIFTRAEDRVADAQTLKEFEDAVTGSAIPQQQMGELNKEKLPGPDFLQSKSGTKEGQIQVIKEADGSLTAHQWSMSQQKWVHVGAVVDSAASGRKTTYNGKEYDYVFDVDIEDGKPPLKLPYNLSQNPYDAATKFLSDNELPVSYLESVANFIVQNTQGATLEQSGPSTAPDPLGTESRYRPGETQQTPKSKLLPQKEYLFITAAKHDAICKKILSVNANLKATGQKGLSLNPDEEQLMQRLKVTLEANSPVTDTLTLAVVLRSLRTWHYADRLALLDWLRCMATSPNVAAYLEDTSGSSIVETATSCSLPDDSASPNENSVMMALRVTTNVFASDQGRLIAASATDSVIPFMEKVVGMDGTGTGIGRWNKNVLTALATAAINYAVMRLQDGSDESGVSDELGLRLVAVLEKVMREQNDSEVVFRVLVALGTLISADKALGKETGVREAVRGVVQRVPEERVRNVGAEVLALL